MKLGWTRSEVSGSKSRMAMAMAGTERGKVIFRRRKGVFRQSEAHRLEEGESMMHSRSKPSSFLNTFKTCRESPILSLSVVGKVNKA